MQSIANPFADRMAVKAGPEILGMRPSVSPDDDREGSEQEDAHLPRRLDDLIGVGLACQHSREAHWQAARADIAKLTALLLGGDPPVEFLLIFFGQRWRQGVHCVRTRCSTSICGVVVPPIAMLPRYRP